MIQKNVSITEAHDKFLKENTINFNAFVRKKIDEAIEEKQKAEAK